MKTSSSTTRPAVLSICSNDTIGHTRQLLLEAAGYHVETIANVRDMRGACRRRTFQLIIVCHSLKKDAKQFIAGNGKVLCPRTPILELCRFGPEMATGHHLIYPIRSRSCDVLNPSLDRQHSKRELESPVASRCVVDPSSYAATFSNAPDLSPCLA